jgi:hypothetical protein
MPPRASLARPFLLVPLAALLLVPSLFACGTKTILVQGRVENAPRAPSVTVELVYERGQVGESDRLELEGASFRTRVPFPTQNHSVDVMGHSLGKCGRMPKSVVVVLLEGDEEIDRVTLNVARDLKYADPSELAVRNEVVLHGPAGSPQK